VNWLGREAEQATELERVLGLLPDAHEAVREFYSIFWVDELVDPVLLELIRLRIAMLHGVEPELLVRYDVARERGLTEEKIAVLSSWPTSPLFTELERQVLGLTEQFVIDPHGVTDEEVAPVKEALTSAGLVALVNAMALIDHLNRLRVAFEVPPADGDRVLVVAAPGPIQPLY
jgi:alkylhydroperoxidase family enzyme